MDVQRAIRLFSYGTLQNPDVQQATFGRLLDGSPDAVVGFRLEPLKITDLHVIAISGSDEHPVLVPAVASDALVEGTVFLLSAAELKAADDYEVDDYQRIEVRMGSGGTAWTYVLRGESGTSTP
jgi:hypothetical protein